MCATPVSGTGVSCTTTTGAQSLSTKSKPWVAGPTITWVNRAPSTCAANRTNSTSGRFPPVTQASPDPRPTPSSARAAASPYVSASTSENPMTTGPAPIAGRPAFRSNEPIRSATYRAPIWTASVASRCRAGPFRPPYGVCGATTLAT